MPEPSNQQSGRVTADQPMTAASPHLRVGLASIGGATVYVAAVLLFGWGFPCVVMPFAIGFLLCGTIAVLCGLALHENRRRPRLWKHLGVLLAIVVLLVFLTVGPGNYFGLLDIRTRLAVALTGGQDELQTWAVQLLSESGEHIRDEYDDWYVPPEYWSEQVRRLHPNAVYVRVTFENNQNGVCLCYGGGFLHWTIVVGPPGSRPHPSLTDPARDTFLFRWADGLYNWFEG